MLNAASSLRKLRPFVGSFTLNNRVLDIQICDLRPQLFSLWLPKSWRAISTQSVRRAFPGAVVIVHKSSFKRLFSAQFSQLQRSEFFGRFASNDSNSGPNPRGQRSDKNLDRDNKKLALYFSSAFFLFIGLAYASAPLYKVFCQTSNIGGELNVHLRDEKAEKLASVDPVKQFGVITVKFHSAKDARLLWDFRPQQDCVKVYPGETALAFFTATNPTDRPIVGVSTYNIVPYEAAPYFNKIQCFCFDEQRLEPQESVDMPVFFYIDPDIVSDYRCGGLKEIVLGYTFFESKGDLELPPANSPAMAAKLFEKKY